MIRPQRGSVSDGVRKVVRGLSSATSKSIVDTMDDSNHGSTTIENNKKTDKTSNKTQHNKTPSSLDESSILQNIVLIVFVAVN